MSDNPAEVPHPATSEAHAGPAAPSTPPPPAPDASLAPVRPAERIEFIDVLRGVALFGILTANMRAFAAPSAVYGHVHALFPGFADVLAQALVDTFVSAKFLTLFAFLFGLGFAVQFTRAEERGVPVGPFYRRRMLALLLFGVVHGTLIWWGDILVPYAVVGFLLLAFARRQPRTLLRWAGGILAALAVFLLVGAVGTWIQGPEPPTPNPARAPEELARVIAVYRSGDPAGILAENARSWVHYLLKDISVLMFLPTFLFGLWVWRSGIVQDIERHRALLARVCRIALPAGLALSAFAVAVTRLRGQPPPQDALVVLAMGGMYYGAPLLSLGYATGLALLSLRPEWHRRLRPFGAVGRMALTNYVMQSLICVPLYVVTGLYGRVGPAGLLVPTVLIFAAQVWTSNWWLARYRFGPLEWVWRTLTYGRIGPLRRPAGAA